MRIEAKTTKRRGEPKTKKYYLYNDAPNTEDYCDKREPVAAFTNLETAAVVARYLEGCKMEAAEQLEARAALKVIDTKEE